MYLIANIIVCVCALAGCNYGGIKFFRPKQALYAQMITLSLGCIAFGRMFNIVRLLTDGNLTDHFQLGILGMIGSLMFFFSANFSAVDTHLDNGAKEYTKYRLIPLAAPGLFAVLYIVLFLLSDVSALWKIQGGVLTLFAMASSYFNLKHLIIPDAESGIVKRMRLYNLLALVYTAAIFAECAAMSRSNEVLTLVCCCVSGLTTAAFIPSITRGVAKWKT
jgi:hypothetical protein